MAYGHHIPSIYSPLRLLPPLLKFTSLLYYVMSTAIAFHPPRSPTLFSISFFFRTDFASRYAHETSAIVAFVSLRQVITALFPCSDMFEEKGREGSGPRRSVQGLVQGTRFHVVDWSADQVGRLEKLVIEY
jgi:hypothetical protein